MPRQTCQCCKYKILLSLLAVYVLTTCTVTCIFLWRSTTNGVGQPSFALDQISSSGTPGRDSLVVQCANIAAEESGTGCETLRNVTLEDYVSSGWTKIVYRALLDGKRVAMKLVNNDGVQVTDCLKTKSYTECHNEAVTVVLNEIHNLQLLRHPNIANLIAYCVRSGVTETGDCVKSAVLATELGEPVTNIRLLQLPWKSRLKLLRDLLQLLHYLTHHPGGPTALLDLRRTQFVIINGSLKLADLDTLQFDEPLCGSGNECQISIGGKTLSTRCTDGRCSGYTQSFNILKAFVEFGPYFLLDADVPNNIRPILRQIRDAFDKSSPTTNELVTLAQQLDAL